MEIKWDSSLLVGIHIIDQQHQELFRRVNALLTAMHENQGQQVVTGLLGFLKQYVVDHFTAEQHLMVKHGYPGYAAHEEQHQVFVGRFLELQDEFEKGGVTLALTLQLNRFVCSWLREHISTTDKELGKFLAARNVAVA